MGKIVFFEDLEVWLQARLFAKDIFLLTEKESFYREFRFKEQIKAQRKQRICTISLYSQGVMW